MAIALAKKIEPLEHDGTIEGALVELHHRLMDVSWAIQEIEIPHPDLPGADHGVVGDCSRLVISLIDAVNLYNGHAE